MFHGLRDQYFQNLQTYRPGAGVMDDISQLPNARQQTEPGLRGQFPFSPDDISYSRAGAHLANHIGNMHIESVSPVTPISQTAPMMPKSTWVIGKASPFNISAVATPPSQGVSSLTQTPVTELPRTTFSVADAKPLPLIPKEVVHSRINTNDQFLEKRRQSRILFQEELRKMSLSSTTSIYSPASVYSPATPATMYSPIEDRRVEGNRASEAFSEDSIPEYSVASSTKNSRLSRNSSSGYDSLMTRQRSQGQFSQGTRSSATSSVQHDRYVQSQENRDSLSHTSLPASPLADRRMSDNIDSWAAPLKPPTYRQQSYDQIASSEQGLIASPPRIGDVRSDDITKWIPASTSQLQKINTHEITSSPEYNSQSGTPQDARRTSGNIGSWGPPSSTARALGYGAGIESGLEVVMDIDHDNEKMVVSQEEMPHFVQPTSTASTKSIDCPITHDTSFYRFGGFCDGAKSMIRGETGFKVVKRPSVS
jgi:hypothetical protein